MERREDKSRKKKRVEEKWIKTNWEKDIKQEKKNKREKKVSKKRKFMKKRGEDKRIEE